MLGIRGFGLVLAGVLVGATDASACAIRYLAFVSSQTSTLCPTCGSITGRGREAGVRTALGVTEPGCLEVIDVHSDAGRARLLELGAAEPRVRNVTSVPTLVAVTDAEPRRLVGRMSGYTTERARSWSDSVELYTAAVAGPDAALSALADLSSPAAPCPLSPGASSSSDAAPPPACPIADAANARELAVAPSCPPGTTVPAARACAAGATELSARATALLASTEASTRACLLMNEAVPAISAGLSSLSRRESRENPFPPDSGRLERGYSHGGWGSQDMTNSEGELGVARIANGLTDAATAQRVRSQYDTMTAAAAARGDTPPDVALATVVAFRESGGQIFSSAGGDRSRYVDVYSQSGMEALGSFFARERDAGRLNTWIPASVTSTWRMPATLSTSEMRSRLERDFPGIENPCRPPADKFVAITNFMNDQGYLCNEARSSIFPQLFIPPEHLVMGATLLLTQARNMFNERTTEFGFSTTGLSARARRFWTQLFFAKPGRASWGTDDSRLVGPHAFMQRLQQLQAAGRIPAGVNPLEFALTWPEFLSYTTARRALVTAQESEMTEAMLTGVCP